MLMFTIITCVVSEKSDDTDCFPIEIPADDPFFKGKSGKSTCMEFTRSTTSSNDDCPLEPRQQVFKFFFED